MWKILALGAGLALVSTSAAMAQPQCDQRESVLQVLQQKYKEQPIALGVTHNGGLVEVLTTGNGYTWSIILTTPQGMKSDERSVGKECVRTFRSRRSA